MVQHEARGRGPRGGRPERGRVLARPGGIAARQFGGIEHARRYPAGPGDYAAAFRAATARAAAAGFVLDDDVDEMVAVATAAYPA